MNQRSIIILTLFCLLLPVKNVFAQEPEKKAEEPPKLEIPEITIVGKKAITLPFARKGEIFDVDLFEAPMPDSSLLGHPPSMSLLSGALPRYEQRQQPWRASVEGKLGNFGTGSARGFLDYKGERWSLTNTLGFMTTGGHTTNASSSNFGAGSTARWVVKTDNQVLKSFRASAGLNFSRDAFGLFGITSSTVRRTDNEFSLAANLGTLDRTSGVLDIDLSAIFTSLNDSYSGIDSSVSIVSPQIRALYSTRIKNIEVTAAASYSGSSLDYGHATQSPSLADIMLGGAWNFGERWRLSLGGTHASGTDNRGVDQTLTSVQALLELDVDSVTTLNFWFRPHMNLSSYPQHVRINPYVSREIELRPERAPMNFGSSLYFWNGIFTLALKGNYEQLSDKGLTIADSGAIRLEYGAARIASVEMEGSVGTSRGSRLQFSGSLTSAHEPGSAAQLPMVPVVRLQGRGEIDVRLPLTAWSSVDYQGPRNVDRQGVSALSGVVLWNVGVSTSAIARILLSGEIRNLLDTRYEWWNGYVAPGIEFNVAAKVNLQ